MHHGQVKVGLIRKGNLKSGIIFGQIECLSRLSGMPELILALGADKQILEEGAFGLHDCITKDNIELNGTISFIPPDGTFMLLDYRLIFINFD